MWFSGFLWGNLWLPFLSESSSGVLILSQVLLLRKFIIVKWCILTYSELRIADGLQWHIFLREMLSVIAFCHCWLSFYLKWLILLTMFSTLYFTLSFYDREVHFLSPMVKGSEWLSFVVGNTLWTCLFNMYSLYMNFPVFLLLVVSRTLHLDI